MSTSTDAHDSGSSTSLGIRLTIADLSQRLKEGDREWEGRRREAMTKARRAREAEEKKKRQRLIRKTVERSWAILIHRFVIMAEGLRYQVIEQQKKAREQQEELKQKAEFHRMEMKRKADILEREREAREERRLEALMREWSLEPSESAFKENWYEYLRDEGGEH